MLTAFLWQRATGDAAAAAAEAVAAAEALLQCASFGPDD